jgi:tetratricopeptide (TPR) repeat protein
LLKVFRAYEYMNRGDLAMERDDADGALEAYSTARAMFPDNLEMKYWHAVSLANLGMVEDALPIFKEIFARDRNWLILTKRLPAVGLLDVSEGDFERILSLVTSPVAD